MQVKFDILTKKNLNEILNKGTKLLHLTSDYFKEDKIVFEEKDWAQ